MTWAMFYLTCFLVGVTLSVVSFLSGSFHLPHFHPHVPHVHVGSVGGGHGAHAGSGGHGSDISFVNFGTICAFLAWFGGTGYLLTRYSTWVVTVIAVASFIAGLVGAAVVFWFIAKVLLAHEHELDPADYDRVGVLARITSSIRESGTGEIVFSQEGTRHTCGARSDTGEALPKGTEVVVTRYERGIAYVQRWEELAGESKAATDAGH
jgi:membrane protein implicated in regulation of membrane protease activity